MPTNVSPEYKKAEAAYRETRDPAERLALLKEMLSTVPKHKGTEHLQADIKTRIKELSAELTGPSKGAARTGPVHTIRPEGAAQVVLIGPPNAGKSSLHVRLTGSQAEIGDYPFTTQAPQPGMLLHEDVPFQLIDLPPIAAESMVSWMPNALQPARAALLVIDLQVPGCVESVALIRNLLEAKRVTLTDDWQGRLAPGYSGDDAATVAQPAPTEPAQVEAPTDGLDDNATKDGEDDDEALDDPFRFYLPTLLVVNKCDLGFAAEEVALLEELVEMQYPALAVSARTGEGLDRIGEHLMRGLGIVRIYTKAPGKPPDMERPYTVFSGGTVADVAALIHRDLAAQLNFARVWGSGLFDGQQVGGDHVVQDGDILELHD